MAIFGTVLPGVWAVGGDADCTPTVCAVRG